MTTRSQERGLLAVIAPRLESASGAGAAARATALASCWSGPVSLVLTGEQQDPAEVRGLPASVRLVAADPATRAALAEPGPGTVPALDRLLGIDSRRGGQVEAIYLMADDTLLSLLPLVAEGPRRPPVQVELLAEAGIPDSRRLWPWAEGVVLPDTERLYPLAATTPALPVRAVPAGPHEAAVRGLSHLPALGGPTRATVVIPVRGGETRVLRTLDSVIEHTPELLEVIVVDDASPDGSLELLGRRAHDDPRIRVVSHDTQRGFAATCNHGLARARGDVVLLLGADTVVTRDWSTRLISHLREYPRAGAVGARTNLAPNFQALARVGYDPTTLEGLDTFARRLARANDGIAMPVSQLCGICLAIPRRTLRLVGGFDPRFFPGSFEDEDWSLRLLSSRLIPYRAEDVFVHHEGATSLPLESRGLDEIHKSNWQRFKAKWELPAELSLQQGYTPEQLPTGDYEREKLFIAPWQATHPVRS
ncbi:MAG: glycosyltransferase family 2 protein [Acidobacteriota bacterium]|nr:glycosyltransferase family 2 protein [Acidobacteriota bacterium]MDQ7087646.1 glycosyltransferase family 2 protein [Acidobacteriota bacterium]